MAGVIRKSTGSSTKSKAGLEKDDGEELFYME